MPADEAARLTAILANRGATARRSTRIGGRTA
jgi:hypothetical protein